MRKIEFVEYSDAFYLFVTSFNVSYNVIWDRMSVPQNDY